MKKLIFLFLIIFFSSITTPLFSDDLGDFKDSVEQEEEENRENEDTGESVEDTDDETDDDNPFLRFLWEFTFFLWFIHNDSVYYTPYPYEYEGWIEGDNFVGHDLKSAAIISANAYYRKNYNFALHSMATVNESFNTIGGMARLSGKFFNHFGPELEYRAFWDGDDDFHIVTAGANLSLFQFDYLSLDFYLEGAFFMGLLERQGITLGAKILTYPFKPVSLEIRSGGMFFQYITFAEVDVKLGFHIGRGEIFADFYTLQSANSSFYAFGVGAGVHF